MFTEQYLTLVILCSYIFGGSAWPGYQIHNVPSLPVVEHHLRAKIMQGAGKCKRVAIFSAFDIVCWMI